MPKKFGTNTKKEEARERKKQKKKEEKERAEKEAEDEYWREKDPKIIEKQGPLSRFLIWICIAYHKISVNRATHRMTILVYYSYGKRCNLLRINILYQ